MDSDKEQVNQKVEEVKPPENKPKEHENINLFFKKTLRNTISAFFLSLINTVVNFICNIPLLRIISKESYGIVKIHLELAFALVNYVPRESIRRTSQKFCPDKDPKKEEEKYFIVCQINLLILFFVSILSVIIFFCFMFFTDSDKLHDNFIQLVIYIICALIELLIEPVILYMNLHVENKFFPITISSLSRVTTNTIFVWLFGMDLWAFTLSRVIGTSVYMTYICSLGLFKYKINFARFIPKDFKSLIFGNFTSNGINTKYLRQVYFEFVKLTILNFILFRCQNLILSFGIKSSNEEKGDYSFINQNYSLVSRFLLEPIIDAFYNLVNKIKYINNKSEQPSLENSEENLQVVPKKDESMKTEESRLTENKVKKADDLEKKDDEEEPQEKKDKEPDKEVNYFITIKLLQLFLKIFTYIGILIIPYYLLVGTEFMGMIYGKKWETNDIDKIGDCYSYYVVFAAALDLIKSFANATNDIRQMKLSNYSLYINSIALLFLMYIFSKWDICGLIIANVISAILLINCYLYIVFCGKESNKTFKAVITTIYEDIKKTVVNCFISQYSIVFTGIALITGHYVKKNYLLESTNLIKLSSIAFIGLINLFLIYSFENKGFKNHLNAIKSFE